MRNYTTNAENGEKIDLKSLKGAPITIDAKSLAKDLQNLKSQNSKSYFVPIYDRLILHDPIPNKIEITNSHKFIIVEGLFFTKFKILFRSNL